jgi:hypothetical protein
MNKRMLELYRQAQVPYTAIDPSNNMPYQTTTFSAEKFAELLITAVMTEVRDEVQYQSGWTLADIVTERVKKEFGVTQ